MTPGPPGENAEPELEPDPLCPPCELDPMLGQGCLVVDSGLEVLGASVVDVDGAGVVVVELVAADAPEMPAIAPPVARAPATIVAPSILEIRIVLSLSVDGRDDACPIMGAAPGGKL